jgi:hypothetical protein
MTYTTTKTIEITIDGGLMSLTSLLDDDNMPDKNCTWLTLYSDGTQLKPIDFWDNPKYLTKTSKQLNKKKYNKDVKEASKALGIKKKDFRKQFLTLIKEAENSKML